MRESVWLPKPDKPGERVPDVNRGTVDQQMLEEMRRARRETRIWRTAVAAVLGVAAVFAFFVWLDVHVYLSDILSASKAPRIIESSR